MLLNEAAQKEIAAAYSVFSRIEALFQLPILGLPIYLHK